MARTTRRQIIGLTYQILTAVQELGPHNPANMYRLTLAEQPRNNALQAVGAILMEWEDKVLSAEQAVKELTRVRDVFYAKSERIKSESP